MVLNAFRGALGFLTRLPIGHDERTWEAFRRTPEAFPAAGYVVGALLALAFALPVPDPTVAAGFVVWVYLLTGVNHADGLADLGDAAAVHGTPETRRDVMTDTTTGVGAVLALAVTVAALALAGFALAALPLRTAAGIVLASEVGAKCSMAVVARLGEPAHEGMGSQVAGGTRTRALGALAVSLPAALFVVPASAAAVVAALAVALWTRRWANRRLGGISGDVLGATNELSRVMALHAGVIAWTLS
ncbi:adenosylcobinamide-GDP ribazoletransferase [Halalkalicoccus salilacus]|uniref:adenosylcobinamide-GDP ribazoletransferase n=1 Tax=Halalkalicoccus TaxID=332246 RepID=UPI002F96780F